MPWCVYLSGCRCVVSTYDDIQSKNKKLKKKKRISWEARTTSAMNVGSGSDCSVIIPARKSRSASQCSLGSFSLCCPVWAIFSLPCCSGAQPASVVVAVPEYEGFVTPAGWSSTDLAKSSASHFHCRGCRSTPAEQEMNRDGQRRQRRNTETYSITANSITFCTFWAWCDKKQ